MAIFSPWAFGTTQEWAIGVMNTGGYLLGLLWAVKQVARRPDQAGQGHDSGRSSRRVTWCLGAITVLILAYCLVSALNARCVFLGDYQYNYFSCLNWLPHSYDARLTWKAFWKYLALALDFWAVRDWLTGLDRREPARMSRPGILALDPTLSIPRRLKSLLWVLSINGAVLATQGLVQRASGSGKLLWLVEPHIHKLAQEQFGPYAYRSNAAQYFLLLWPVTFGFWQLLSRARPGGPKLRMHNHLLPCVLAMALIPLISLSRAGAIISIWAILGVIIAARWNRPGGGGVVLTASALLSAGALLAVYLAGEPLAERFHGGVVDVPRLGVWRNTWLALEESPIFGTGPGTFGSVYNFYWSGADQGIAQAHNDWLELLMTFGAMGSLLLLCALALVLAHPFTSPRLYLGKTFPRYLYIALGNCLLYALVDFPLAIYSILFLFVVECAILASVSARTSEV